VVGVTDRSLLNQVSESGSQCASSYRELLQQIHVVSCIFGVETHFLRVSAFISLEFLLLYQFVFVVLFFMTLVSAFV